MSSIPWYCQKRNLSSLISLFLVTVESVFWGGFFVVLSLLPMSSVLFWEECQFLECSWQVIFAVFGV